MTDAVAYIKGRLSLDPQATITFAELMRTLEITDRSNFNKTIRKHREFKLALERLGLVEVGAEGASTPNALRRLFGPEEGEDCVSDV